MSVDTDDVHSNKNYSKNSKNNISNIKGQIISGAFGEIIARQKAGVDFELGELLICEDESTKYILQVFDIMFASQISNLNLELISGMNLEDNTKIDIYENDVRNYRLAKLKSLFIYNKEKKIVYTAKSMPPIFTKLRSLNSDDLEFFLDPKDPLFIGYLRSGSKAMDIKINLPATDVLSHHVLISGTTGKGKSVLMSNLLWDITSKNTCATLVLDPHDEYFGRKNDRLSMHPSKKVAYYTPRDVPKGARTLKINLKNIRPHHLGCLDFSDPQEQAQNAYFREYGIKWIEAIILDKPLKVSFNDGTINVLKRRMMQLLDIDFKDSELFCNGVFDIAAGQNTINDICNDLENAFTIIIDTSAFSGHQELLIGSMVASEVFYRYRKYKTDGTLQSKPVVSIVLEEAPRVLGKDILERGSNIFSTIAREGRKFRVGLTAITQLPSLIPREILANINTKIILGTEMIQERQAIIDSASQDLSQDTRAIASLDKGECIISSNFARFAIPIKVPMFEDFIKKDLNDHSVSIKNSKNIQYEGFE